MQKATVTSLLFLLILIGGCSQQFREDFGKLFPLRNEICTQLNHKNVKVIIQNGNCLGVTVINSRFNDSEEKEKDLARKNILKVISTHFADSENITRAWISFQIYKNYYIFHYSNSLDTKFYRKVNGAWKLKY